MKAFWICQKVQDFISSSRFNIFKRSCFYEIYIIEFLLIMKFLVF